MEVNLWQLDTVDAARKLIGPSLEVFSWAYFAELGRDNWEDARGEWIVNFAKEAVRLKTSLKTIRIEYKPPLFRPVTLRHFYRFADDASEDGPAPPTYHHDPCRCAAAERPGGTHWPLGPGSDVRHVSGDSGRWGARSLCDPAVSCLSIADFIRRPRPE